MDPRTRSHRTWWTTAALAVALACGPAEAGAQQGGSPDINAPPVLTGTPQVGAPIEATAAVWSGSRLDAEETYTWLRCTSTSLFDCAVIEDARGRSYTAVQADEARHLRVVLTVINNRGSDEAVSNPTTLVAAMPLPPPPESPPPESPPPESPPPARPPAASEAPPAAALPAAPPPSGEVLGEQIRVMRPFPVVRIRGFLTSRGAVISLFTVRTPRATSIAVRCIGRRCPRRTWRRTARRAGVTRVKAFERSLRAGVRLRIRVMRVGFLGKQTTIRIRRGKAPARGDRCLRPGARRPTACPAP